jgi:hypothetical protein
MSQYKLTLRYSKYVDVYVEARDKEHARDLANECYQAIGLTPAVSDPERCPLPAEVLSFEGDEEDLGAVLIWALDDPDDEPDMDITNFGLFSA